MISETTINAYLNGRLNIEQPSRGYRAGVDPVLLAAAVPAQPGEHVLELGCGVGTALFCLGVRVAALKLCGVEIQSTYAALARRNAAANNLQADIVSADLNSLPDEIRQHQFSHVFANPPYFDRSASTRAMERGREVAMGEGTPLTSWVEVAARRLAPKGTATFIHRAERLPDLLSAMSGQLGSIQVLPLQARVGRDAGLVLVRGRKAGKADFRLHAPVLMHVGAVHDGDRESYTTQIRDVLRHGAPLAFSR